MTENCKLREVILSTFYNILQQKLWNTTNFVMLFQAVMKLLSRHVEIKNLVKGGKVHFSMWWDSYIADWSLFTPRPIFGTIAIKLATSFPASSLWWRKDPGRSWSRGSIALGGERKCHVTCFHLKRWRVVFTDFTFAIFDHISFLSC